MKRGWWLSCLAVFGCSEEGGALLPPGSTSSNFWAVVAHVDGSPAASALVYDISTSQPELLIRTDGAGRFGLDEAPKRLLVRSGFDEVEIADDLRSGMTIDLANTKDRPETLEIKGVGMEQSYLRNATKMFNTALVGHRLYVASWYESEQRIELVMVNLTTGDVTSVRSVPMVGEPRSVLWADEIGVFWYFAEKDVVSAGGPWNFVLAETRSAEFIAEDLVDSSAARWVHNGHYVDLLEEVRQASGDRLWRHRRFDRTTGTIEVYDRVGPRLHTRDLVSYAGRFFHCGREEVAVYNPSARTLEPTGLNGTRVFDCTKVWHRQDGPLWVFVGERLELWSADNRMQYSLQMPSQSEFAGRVSHISSTDDYALLQGFGSAGAWVLLVDLAAERVIDLSTSFPPQVGDLYAYQRGREVYVRGRNDRQPTLGHWQPGDTRVEMQDVPGIHDLENCSAGYWHLLEDNELDFYTCYDRELSVGSLFEANNGTKRAFFGSTSWQERHENRLFYTTSRGDEQLLVSISRDDPR